MEPTLNPLTLLYNPSRLGDVLDAMEAIHSAASDGELNTVTTVSGAELRGWLNEIIYLATQTLDELDAGTTGTPTEEILLRLVRKSS